MAQVRATAVSNSGLRSPESERAAGEGDAVIHMTTARLVAVICCAWISGAFFGAATFYSIWRTK